MPEIKAGESIKLEHGMKLKFVATEASCATYKIEILNNSLTQQLQLTLLRIDSHSAYPEKIVVNTDEFKFGRNTDHALTKIPTLSRQHAVIKKNNSDFIYEHKGQNPALIIPTTKNRLATLLHEIETNLSLLEFTSNLEKDSGEIPAEEMSIGGKTENALISFILFLKSYRYLNFSQLQQRNELILFEKLITTLKQLKKQRIEIRKIQTDELHKQDLKKYHFLESQTYSYHHWLNGFINSLYEKLMASNNREIFLLGGTSDHHVIHKLYINKQSGRHHLITYNAGLDVIEIENSDEVMGTHETLLKSNVDIKNFLFTLYEKKLRNSYLGTSPIYEILKKEMNAYLEDITVRYRICSKQHRVNCTTRSIREMLRDHLTEKTFIELIEFIKSPKKILAELRSFKHIPDKQGIENKKKRSLLSISGELFFTPSKSSKCAIDDTPSNNRSHEITAFSLGY